MSPTSEVFLIPVHNRRATTAEALRRLRTERITGWATILVIDDGSTDGTDAMLREYPEVAVLRGDGTWWWGGAIRRGMEWALARGAERVFWLNDDCAVSAGGLRMLANEAARRESVVWIEARTPSGWTYGGHRKTAFGLRRCRPDEEARGLVDTISGNCVALPRRWVERVGLPDDAAFPHGLGDLDYGLRLRAKGAELRPLAGVWAVSEEPGAAAAERWLTTARPMMQVWREFSTPRSFLYFPAWRAFALRHWGPLWGMVVFALPYTRWAAIAALRGIAPAAARRLGRRRG